MFWFCVKSVIKVNEVVKVLLKCFVCHISHTKTSNHHFVNSPQIDAFTVTNTRMESIKHLKNIKSVMRFISFGRPKTQFRLNCYQTISINGNIKMVYLTKIKFCGYKHSQTSTRISIKLFTFCSLAFVCRFDFDL